MRIFVSPKAEKQIKKTSRIEQIALIRKIKQIGQPKLQINHKKLKGYKNIYRVRLGDFRIVYKKTTKDVYIIAVGHRKDIYKNTSRLVK